MESISEVFNLPASNYFWIKRDGDKLECGHKDSFYAKDLTEDKLTFDISNNKVLANVSPDGSIKNLSLYRTCYPVDGIPGVWWNKDFSSNGPFSYKLLVGPKGANLGGRHMGQHLFDISEYCSKYKTSLIQNIIPKTQYDFGKFEINTLVFTPISSDGNIRPRGVFYPIHIKNKTDTIVSGTIIIPEGNENVHIDIPEGTNQREYKFTLKAKEELLLPIFISGIPVTEVWNELNDKTIFEWLEETITYFKNITGNLQIPENPILVDFFERAIHQCLESVGMNRTGEIVGSNWGTVPTTNEIWMKDMFYSYLPFFSLEPDFFKNGLLWFLNKSVRPKGKYLDGGLNHSLSNSLTPVIMAGLYYQATGDSLFFKENPEVIEKIKDLLKQTLESKIDSRFLFPSIWISDGYSLGDVHTGTNVVVWFCFKSIAEIVERIDNDEDLANNYRKIASKIKHDLDELNIVEGPLGKQYIEGVDKDGSIPLFCHDGEESDTTLMPFYNYTNYDDIAYHNHKRVAMTKENSYYVPSSKGIRWEHGTDATFPGYITGLASIKDKTEMFGNNGKMTRIIKLTDLDGSLWWWPYPKDRSDEEYPVRMNLVGKCGWASGVFATHFISQILGLNYDSSSKVFNFSPLNVIGDFKWNDFPFGYSQFSVGYQETDTYIKCYLENKNDYNIKVNYEFIIGNEVVSADNIFVNDKLYNGEVEFGNFFAKKTLKLQMETEPFSKLIITINK